MPKKGKVIEGNFVTRVTLPAKKVLRQAADAKLSVCIVVGFDEDGDEYFASTHSDAGEVIWHLERAKLKLLRYGDKRDG